MATKVGEFFLDLVVDASKGELTIGNLVSKMGELEVASVGEISILTALAEKLQSITTAAIDSAVGLKNYSIATGASTEELQKWQNVALHAGISAETVAQSFEAISQGLVGLKKYGEHSHLANLLNPLHMSLEKYKDYKPEELMRAIRDNPWFQNLDSAAQKFVLAKAGLADTLGVLTKKGPYAISDKQFQIFAKEGGEISETQIKKWVEIHSLMVSIEELTTRIGRDIANWFSSPIQAALEAERKGLEGIADAIERIHNPSQLIDFYKGLWQNFEYQPSPYKRNLTNNPLFDIIQGIQKSILGEPVSLTNYPWEPQKQASVINVTHRPTININGTRLSRAELEEAMVASHRRVNLELTTNLGSLVV